MLTLPSGVSSTALFHPLCCASSLSFSPSPLRGGITLKIRKYRAKPPRTKGDRRRTLSLNHLSPLALQLQDQEHFQRYCCMINVRIDDRQCCPQCCTGIHHKVPAKTGQGKACRHRENTHSTKETEPIIIISDVLACVRR